MSMTLFINGAYIKIASKQPPPSASTKPVTTLLEDFKAEAEVFSADQKILRLKITLNPKMTNDSTFDVFVQPHGSQCHEEWCSHYGQRTKNATLFIPKDPPTSDGYHTHTCIITPGCKYTVIVESEKFRSKVNYTVPDPFGNIYSCHHANDLPNVKTNAKIDTQLMTISWEIIGTYRVPSDIKVYIVVIITEANAIDKELKFFNHTLEDPKQRFGQFQWTTPSSEVDYLTRTYVVDSNDCRSKTSPYPFRVKGHSQEHSKKEKPTDMINSMSDNKYPVHVIWLIIGVSSSVIILGASLIYFNKTRQTSNAIDIRTYRSQSNGVIRPGTITMKDNPNYDNLWNQNGGNSFMRLQEEIPHSSLQILNEIGRGAFGTVYLARAENICGKPGIQNVAVKELRKRPTEEEKEEFFSEIQTMKTVGRHSNVVALLGCCTRKEPLRIVMEYVGCGDLLEYLRTVRAKHEERFRGNRNMNICEPDHPLLPTTLGRYLDLMNSSTTSTSDSSYVTESEGVNLRPSVTDTMYTTLSQDQAEGSLEYLLDHKELHNFATQIARGMKHLHEKQITHRDLAARNILIDEKKTLKISDFGLSRSGIYVNTKNKKVPLRWLSIEAMRDNLYSNKSDVWAFGIVLYEIGTLGGDPYPTVSNHELLSYLSSGKRLEQPENCSKYLYDLMLHCWAHNPDDRPGFSEILSKLEPVHQKIYVDFSELSSDYVFPPTKEQIQNNKLKTALNLMK